MTENNTILEKAIGPKYKTSDNSDIEGYSVKAGDDLYTEALPLTEGTPIHPDSLHHIPDRFVKKPTAEDNSPKRQEISPAAKWLTDHLKRNSQ
ncbi:MAG TPA: hypothetical protein VF189_02180 [Patescibacteria group bacterium]